MITLSITPDLQKSRVIENGTFIEPITHQAGMISVSVLLPPFRTAFSKVVIVNDSPSVKLNHLKNLLQIRP